MKKYKIGDLVKARPGQQPSGSKTSYWLAEIVPGPATESDNNNIWTIKYIRMIGGDLVPRGRNRERYLFTDDHLEPYIELSPETDKIFKGILRNM